MKISFNGEYGLIYVTAKIYRRQFMKVLGLTGSIKDEILNKKCEVLFAEHLPKKQLRLEVK